MITLIAALLLCVGVVVGQSSSQQQFRQVDAVVNDAVQTGLIPGAVLIIGHSGQVVYRQAYGSRALVPRREAMTVDTDINFILMGEIVRRLSGETLPQFAHEQIYAPLGMKRDDIPVAGVLAGSHCSDAD